MSITAYAQTYSAWGVTAPINKNQNFKGWCSVFKNYYQGYEAQYITKKIHYIQTGFSVYNDENIQKIFKNNKKIIESSIYINSAILIKDFNIELKIATAFNNYPDKNLYYYIEYIDKNGTVIKTEPEKNGTSISYYGICRANSLKEATLAYATDTFENGIPENKDEDGNILEDDLEIGRYITLGSPKDDSIKKIAVTMSLFSSSEEKIGSIPQLSVSSYISSCMDSQKDNNGEQIKRENYRIIRIEIPSKNAEAFWDDTVSYAIINISEQTDYGLNKNYSFKVTRHNGYNLSSINVGGISDNKYWFFGESTGGNITFNMSLGSSTEAHNKIRQIIPYFKYNDQKIELIEDQLESLLIYNGDSLNTTFNDNNYVESCIYTLLKSNFDKIITDNVAPEDCYDQLFYFGYEVTDTKGSIYSKVHEITIKLTESSKIELSFEGIDFINDSGERIPCNPSSHYFMNGMKISPRIKIKYATSENITFSLCANIKTGNNITSFSSGSTQVLCLNNNDGKISKGQMEKNISYITEVKISLINFAVENNSVPVSWVIKVEGEKTGEHTINAEEKDTITSKAYFLSQPEITGATVGSTGTGIQFAWTKIRPISSTLAYPDKTKTCFKLIGDIEDIIEEELPISSTGQSGSINFSVPIFHTTTVKIDVFYKHEVTFKVDEKTYKFVACGNNTTSGPYTITGVTPTIVYRKNCLGINVDQVKDDAVLVIQSLTAKNKIYLGDRGKITISENTIKLENFTIDCGTW